MSSGENSGFTADDMTISAEQVAGRDIYNTYEQVTIENPNGFTQVNTSSYSAENFTSPVFTDELVEKLTANRLLILAGGAGFDKSSFARYLATCVAEREVMEWRDADNGRFPADEIRETDKPTVFILNQVLPQLINYDISQFVSLAGLNHLLILTTELSAQAWQLPGAAALRYWYEIPEKNIYSKEQLCNAFIRRFRQDAHCFNNIDAAEIQPETPIGRGRTVKELAAGFVTEQQINMFFSFLPAEQHLQDEEKIQYALKLINDTSESLISKWYKRLQSGEKLIALGAAMFEGLFDDQFFAVMQRVIDDFWKHRDSRLCSLDYADLDFLLSYFKFEPYTDGRIVLQSKSENYRAEIIRVAWTGNKRHILSAFSILIQLAGTSSARFSKKAADRDINGTRDRGIRLRNVTAETISDIGIVSLQAAEPRLLELASVNDDAIRRITARAIARWRIFGKEEQLYDTLARWTNYKSNVVNATIVMALKYTAEFDNPGQLDYRVMNILVLLAEKKYAATDFCSLITHLCTAHLERIVPVLENNLATYPVYSDCIATGFLKVYAYDPQLVKTIIDKWLETYFGQASAANWHKSLTNRDSIIMLVMKVCRQLPYNGNTDAISLGYVWSLIEKLHAQEQRKAMREFILDCAAHMIGVNPEEAIIHIKPIYLKIGISDRFMLINAIGAVYLGQRLLLENPEYYVTVGQFTYPSWFHTWRPVTEIETILYRWLHGYDSFAREIATLSFITFVRILDLEESRLLPGIVAESQKRAHELKQQREWHAANTVMENAVQFPVMPALSLWTQIKIFFWLFFKTPQEKQILREFMNTILMYRQTNPAYLNMLRLRWQGDSRPINVRLAWWLGKIMS